MLLIRALFWFYGSHISSPTWTLVLLPRKRLLLEIYKGHLNEKGFEQSPEEWLRLKKAKMGVHDVHMLM